MFSKKITDTDTFLDMPLSSQALYFHLNMHADDDGFVSNAKTIRRMTGASEDDLKLLLAKQFIFSFESGVVVIKDWKIHNYIRKDTYNNTIYSDEKEQLVEDKNGAYTFCGRPVTTGQVRISPHSDNPKYGPDDRPYQIAQHLLGKIRENNPDFKQPNLQYWANDIRLAHGRDKRDYDKLDRMLEQCQNDNFWQANILSGKKMRDQYDQLVAQANRKCKDNKI